jgi:hypothetical protein
MSLRNSFKIQALAADLGLKPSNNPVQAILKSCEKRTDRILRQFPDCHTLSDLLMVMADELGAHFEVVRSNEDIGDVQERYLQRGERIFSGLSNELSNDVYGITFRRTARKDWERPYVSVIDCRGEKRNRSYFTKWHELGHLLVITDQMRLAFRRTHVEFDTKDPEEAMVDLIAGAVGFLPRIVRPHAKGRPSFANFKELRQKLCPEASRSAMTQGFANAWPTPCLLLQGKAALKRGEERWLAPPSFDFCEGPKPALRAVRVRLNDAARTSDLMIFPNMRVPVRSVIYQVFEEQVRNPQTSVEDLSWWEASQGTQLPHRKVLVEARSVNGAVDALITPL